MAWLGNAEVQLAEGGQAQRGQQVQARRPREAQQPGPRGREGPLQQLWVLAQVLRWAGRQGQALSGEQGQVQGWQRAFDRFPWG